MKATTIPTKWVTIIVIAMVSVFLLATGLYIPSLPQISKQLAVSNHLVQMSFNIYVLFFGISQLISGPLSDHLGRRWIAIGGLLLFIIGTSFILMHETPQTLLLTRAIQGLGSGAIAVVAKAIFRDIFHGPKLAVMLTYTFMIGCIIPIITPVVGGYLTEHLGWRSVFIVLFLFAIIIAGIVSYFLPETLSKSERLPKLGLRQLIKNYYQLLCNNRFLCYAAILILNYTCMVIYMTYSTFIFQQQLGVSAEKFGLITLIPGSGFFLGTLISNVISRVRTEHTIFRLSLCLVSGCAIIFLYTGFTQQVSILNLSLAFMLLMMSYGMIFPSGLATALRPFNTLAGTAAALYGFSQMVGSALIAAFINAIADISVTLVGFATLGIAILFSLLFNYAKKLP